jgi:dephospho-CoA kinase
LPNTVSANPRVIGLTGGIGSGKSTVANEFARLGVPVIDTDAIAHELTGPGGAAMPAIRDAFGDTVITTDGALDRGAMRLAAFTDPAMRQRLEAILHPRIRELSDQRIAEALAQPGSSYVLLVVPLLVESGSYRQRVETVVVVDCREETQMARVEARSGLARNQVEQIMAAQVDRAVRLEAADAVIDNDGSLEALRRQVAELDARFRLKSSE